jgi:hypothetical protein
VTRYAHSTNLCPVVLQLRLIFLYLQFLIWASVPCEPIGILDTASIRKLVEAMKFVTELNYDRGVYLADVSLPL